MNVRWAGVGLLVAGIALPAGATEPVDPRSHELLRLDCRTGGVRSELTLFANGTLRLREGEIGAELMTLAELDPDGIAAIRRRLQAESLGPAARPRSELEGEWLERCRLVLDVPDGPRGGAEFGNLERVSLELSRILAIADELTVIARLRSEIAGLGPDYVPTPGDVLIDRSGARYRVRGWTTDRRGVELHGIDQPLTVYVAVEALAQRFVGVEEATP